MERHADRDCGNRRKKFDQRENGVTLHGSAAGGFGRNTDEPSAAVRPQPKLEKTTEARKHGDISKEARKPRIAKPGLQIFLNFWTP